MGGRRSRTIKARGRARGTTPSGCRDVLGEPRLPRTTPAARSPLTAGGRSRRRGERPPSAVEDALRLALERAAGAYAASGCWEERVRASLAALLCLFEERPDVAHLCIVQPDSAGPTARALRDDALALLAQRIDDGRRDAHHEPPEHAAQAVLGGAIGAIRARLLEPDQASVRDLLEPLTSFILLPYRGAAAARGKCCAPASVLSAHASTFS